VVIGHGLESCTTNVQEVDVQIDEKTVTLIDTPGFDDTNRTDTDVLTEIANYLESKFVVRMYHCLAHTLICMISSYRQNRRLTGVIFLHRITDNRMSGVSYKNILMFQKLIGNSVLDHVICCTTMWDREEEPKGEFARREEELKTRYWSNMIAGSAQMARHNNSAQSARSIIAKIVYKKPVTLRIQRELVDDHKKLSETSAGVEVNKELAKMLANERAQLERKLQEMEMARAKLDADRQADLERLKGKIAAAEAREEEARRNHEKEIADIRVENQRASFGLAMQIKYEPSNDLHQGRPVYVDGEGEKIRGHWRQLIAKVSWPSAN